MPTELVDETPASDSPPLALASPTTPPGPPDGASLEPRLAGRGRLLSFLAVVLAILVLLLLYQVQRAADLEQTVGELRQELTTAHQELGGYQRRMEVVRSHVDDLSARVGALRNLVTDDDERPRR